MTTGSLNGIQQRTKKAIRALEMEISPEPNDGWACNGCPYLAEGMAHCLSACMKDSVEALKVLEDLLDRIRSGQIVERKKLIDEVILLSASAGSDRGDPMQRVMNRLSAAAARPELLRE